MKAVCFKCGALAVWYYMPRDVPEHRFCDNCVHRGCSCNYDENDKPILDEQGREYPCCEYGYDENGIDDE